MGALSNITTPRIDRLRFPVAAQALPGFDADAFYRRWNGVAGSAYRDRATGELVLMYSLARISPEREAAAAELRRPGVAEAVLEAIDRRDARIDAILSGTAPAGPLR